MLDTSNSLGGKSNLKTAIKFIKNVYSALSVSALGYHIGLVTFGSSASAVFDFSQYTTLTALDEVRYNWPFN